MTSKIEYTIENETMTVKRNDTRECKSASEFFYRLAATMENDGKDATKATGKYENKEVHYIVLREVGLEYHVLAKDSNLVADFNSGTCKLDVNLFSPD